jgi:hypothetical protein
MQKNDLDSMLENFLMDNHVEDNGFSQKVTEQLPKISSWIWLQDAVPALAFSVLCVLGWSYHQLILQSFFMYRAEFYQWLGAQVGSTPITISYSALAGVGCVIGYFVFEKIQQEIELF